MKTIYTEAKQRFSSCIVQNKKSNKNKNNDNENETNDDTRFFHTNHAVSGDDDRRDSINLQNNHCHLNYDGSQFLSRIKPTSAYETLQHPFKHDKSRGKLSSAADFYFACTCHAFASVNFSEIPVFAFLFSGVYFLPAYLVSIVLYVIPIFAIQTFLGQFSTSGSISALRVSPIFKGFGYSILILNLTSLAYYGVIAAVPLIYAANSLHTVIPWMTCDNAWNSPNCSTHTTYNEEDDFLYPHATVEFFRSIIRTAHDNSTDYSLSLPILCGVIGVWLLVLAIVLKRISFIGKFFRCVSVLLISCFIAIFVNLLLHGHISWPTFLSYFEPTIVDNSKAIMAGMRTATFTATWILGPGWGSVLTIASYNSFRRNSEKLTYWVTATHVLISLAAIICGRIALDHFEDHVGMFHYHVEEEHFMQFLYLCFGYIFGSLTSLPNFWSFLFFSMIFLAELCAVIIQMVSVLTSIFDEFEKLRTKKAAITIGLSLLMLLISIYFCTKQGFEHLHLLPTLAILTHVAISIVLLFMTVWIYGRERFQCDMQFMLGKTISNLKIFILRFITPAFLVITLFQILYFLENDDVPCELIMIGQSFVYVIAPAYMIYKLYCTTGNWRSRAKQCFAPHDWHPVDADNRRFYEEVMGTSEMLVITNYENHPTVP